MSTKKTEKTPRQKSGKNKREKSTARHPASGIAEEKPVAVILGNPTPTDTGSDGSEIVVFAFRLSRSERDELHAATGSAKASKFVKAIVLAGARGDMKAVTELIDELHTRRQ